MSRLAVTRLVAPVLLLAFALMLAPGVAQSNPTDPVHGQLVLFDAPITLQLELLEPASGVIYDGDLVTFGITIQNMSTSVSYPRTEVRFYFSNTLSDFFYASDDGTYVPEPGDLHYVIWQTSQISGDEPFGPGRQWQYTVTLIARHTTPAVHANHSATARVYDNEGHSSQGLQEYVYFDLAMRPTPTPVAPRINLRHTLSAVPPHQVGDPVGVRVLIQNLDNVTINHLTITMNYPMDRLAVTGTDPDPDDQAPGWMYWRDLTVDLGEIRPGQQVSVSVDFRVLAPCPPGAEISVDVRADADYGSYTGRTYVTDAFTLPCEASPGAGDLQAQIVVPTQMPLGVRRYYVVQVNNTGLADAYGVHVVLMTDGLLVHEQIGPGDSGGDRFDWVLQTIPAGGSGRVAILFEVPPGTAIDTVFHTSVTYEANNVAPTTVNTDITVIAPPPTRTPTPTPLPALRGDIACQVVDPVDGEMATGEQMTIRMRASNTGANAIEPIAVLLDWDAGCLDYVRSEVIPPDPEVSSGDGSWLWEHWGVPYLQPNGHVDMQVTLKAKSACGLTTLSASFTNPAAQRGSFLDRCSSNVTIVKPSGAAASPALAQQVPMPATTPQPPGPAADGVACTQLIANRTFEMTATQSGAPLFWETAGNLAPRTVTETVYSGNQSLLIGLPGLPEVAGDGWAWQWVTIPADAQSAVLRFYSKVISMDSDSAYDRFEAGALQMDPMRIIGGLEFTATHDWTLRGVDMAPYAGQTVAVAFHVRQDGNAGRTWAFVDDVSLCVEPPAVPVPGPSETGTEGMCWQDEAVDYALAGMPDFDQVREGGKSSPTSAWTLDAPAAVADVLWWLDSVRDMGELPPPALADHFGLVTAYDTAYDDHSAYNVPPLIADLAGRFGTSAEGTRPGTVVSALRQYIASKGLQNQFTVTLHREPTKDFLESAADEGDGVILLLGFWEWQGAQFARLGGHYAALAGIACEGQSQRLALSDPWRDAAEAGHDGRVSPWYRHMHSGSPNHTPHDKAVVTSQDVYPLGEVGGVVSLAGYSRELGDLANFLGLNFALEQGDPAAYRGGLVFTRVDYAIVVAPAGGIAAQSATIGTGALLHGTLTRQGWPSTNTPDFPILVTLWRPYEFFPTYAWALSAYGGVEFTTPAFEPGKYMAKVKGEGTVANVRLLEEFAAGTTHLDFGALRAGDIVGDGRVDALDVSALVAAIADGSTDHRFDLNADGAINGGDMALARANFGAHGDVLVGMGNPPAEQAESGEIAAADADSAAYLALVPPAAVAHIGHNFTVAVMAYAPEGPFDTAEVHLQFDPALLQVVDAAGNPVPYIKASGVLPTVVQNKVDNVAGRIDFAATTLSLAGFQGTFPIAHIRFKPLAASEGTPVRFLSQGWPVTQAAWRGTPVLRRFVGAEFQISDQPLEQRYLPVVMKR